MDRQEIGRILRDLNPHWEAQDLSMEPFLIDRDALTTLREREGVRAVVGLRRTGKTTLLKQFMAEVATDIGFERTCYFSFDLEGIDVRDVVETFCEDIRREPVNDLDRAVHFFLDEVQNRRNWSNQVKHFVDNYENMAFTVTGSSAMNILKGGGESLAGRLTPLRLYPFSFREYLRYQDVEREPVDLSDTVPGDRESRIRFEEYLEAGGMPELYHSRRPVERLEETTDLVFYRDIIEMFDAARSSVLQGMFRYLATNSGQMVNFNKIADSLDADFRTVKKYLDYLEDSFLISRSHPYSGSEIASMRKNPKVYVADHAYNRLHGTDVGLKAETVAYNHLRRIEDPAYLRDPETDIVLPERGALFEVKYRDEITTADLTPLAENAADTGFTPYLVSKDTHDTRTVDGHEIEVRPLHTLCLTV